MQPIRLFESGGEMPEEKIMALIMYLIEAGALDPKSLSFSESETEYELTLITPFGRVNFEANGESYDQTYNGEGYWDGTEEFWRRLGGVDYYLWTEAVYRGKEHDDLTYVESKSIIRLESKPVQNK